MSRSPHRDAPYWAHSNPQAPQQPPATHDQPKGARDPRARLDEALADIVMDWPSLTRVPITGGSVATGAGGGDVRLPGGTHRLNLIHDTERTIRQLAELVLTGRELPGATVPTTTPQTAVWLGPHTPWLAETLGRADVEGLRSLAAQIRNLVAPSGIRRIPVGPCPMSDCPGVIIAKMTGDTDTDANQILTCDVDPEHGWARGMYGVLARMLGEDAPERMSPPDLAGYLTARFRATITTRHIHGWALAYPLTLRADDDGTYDRVAFTDWYIAYRAARAVHSA